MKRTLISLALITLGGMLISCNRNSPSNDITVYGNIIDGVTGNVLFNVKVQDNEHLYGSTVTGNDGNYEFSLPKKAGSTIKLEASKEGYQTAEYELNWNNYSSDRIKVDFQLLKDGITIQGTVTDIDGNPVADALVSETYSDMGSTFTDETGTYSLTFPLKYSGGGTYTIKISKEGYRTNETSINYTKADLGRIYTNNVTLVSSNAQVCGIVTNESNKPLSNILVSVTYGNSRYEYGTCMTNANGEYSIDILANDRDYYIQPSSDDMVADEYKLHLSKVDGGKKYVANFKMHTNKATICGTVTRSGVPVIGDKVTIRYKSGSSYYNYSSTITDARGQYSVQVVVPKTYEVGWSNYSSYDFILTSSDYGKTFTQNFNK